MNHLVTSPSNPFWTHNSAASLSKFMLIAFFHMQRNMDDCFVNDEDFELNITKELSLPDRESLFQDFLI